MASDDDLNTSAIAIVGLLGAIILFALVVVLMIVFYHVEARQRYEKDVSQAYDQVSRLAADQQGRLAGYGWVDQQKRIAHIPIKRAKELVVEELAQDPNADVTGAGSGSVRPSSRTPMPPNEAKENEDGQ